jgi:hypothetical protein
MSDVVHWRAGHTPHTGNQHHGVSLDYRGGLTVTGLKEFQRVSHLWHQLVRDPLSFQLFPRSETANHVSSMDVLNGA